MSILSNLRAGLLPASFRGVPFAVSATSEQFGRRIAEHAYPGKDQPWAEDMGRAPRRFRISGFLLNNDPIYIGGPIAAQRLLLTAAAEKKGSGLLTHPTYGIVEVSCPSLSFGEDLAGGTMSEVSFEFVESGKQIFPTILSLSSGLLSAALLCDVAIAADFARVALVASGDVGSSSASAATGAACAAQVTAQSQDATALLNLAAQLPGNNGRYTSGANAGYAGATSSPYGADATVEDLIVAASTQRSAIVAAAAQVAVAAANIGDAASCATLTTAMTALIAALLAACADPGDAVRLLIDIITSPPASVASSTASGSAIIDAYQRAAVTALVRACGLYQPASYDDAAALLGQVSTLIDQVATAAADAGDDATYDALDALLVEIVSDLRARGAELSPMKTFAFLANLPDVVLAQRLYRDPARADELLREADPVHPLFMPTSFRALAA